MKRMKKVLTVVVVLVSISYSLLFAFSYFAFAGRVLDPLKPISGMEKVKVAFIGTYLMASLITESFRTPVEMEASKLTAILNEDDYSFHDYFGKINRMYPKVKVSGILTNVRFDDSGFELDLNGQEFTTKSSGLATKAVVGRVFRMTNERLDWDNDKKLQTFRNYLSNKIGQRVAVFGTLAGGINSQGTGKIGSDKVDTKKLYIQVEDVYAVDSLRIPW